MTRRLINALDMQMSDDTEWKSRNEDTAKKLDGLAALARAANGRVQFMAGLAHKRDGKIDCAVMGHLFVAKEGSDDHEAALHIVTGLIASMPPHLVLKAVRMAQSGSFQMSDVQ